VLGFYTVLCRPLEVPGGVTGINDRGQIVGAFFDSMLGMSRGFLLDGTTLTFIDVPGADGTEAFGINDGGEVVGQFFSNTDSVGFVTDGVTFTPIEVPGQAFTEAHGINDRGQIVGGTSRGGDPFTFRGFLWDGTTFTSIDAPGTRDTAVYDINDRGQIVGVAGDFFVGTVSYSFLKDDTGFTTIEVPGAVRTIAQGLNDGGQIVGQFTDATGTHGFLWDGTMFTTIDVPGADGTAAVGLNDGGQIVGTFWDATGTHSFVATPIVDTTAPVITIAASPATLSPPNGKLVTVTVSGTITDGLGGSGVDASSAAYQVIDEYGQIQPSGPVTPDEADGSYAFTVDLQASRNGNDRDGRRYTIEVSATDHAGNEGAKSATVTVPRK
jgi:probable HAF family extracellular repeat protein